MDGSSYKLTIHCRSIGTISTMGLWDPGLRYARCLRSITQRLKTMPETTHGWKWWTHHQFLLQIEGWFMMFISIVPRYTLSWLSSHGSSMFYCCFTAPGSGFRPGQSSAVTRAQRSWSPKALGVASGAIAPVPAPWTAGSCCCFCWFLFCWLCLLFLLFVLFLLLLLCCLAFVVFFLCVCVCL